MKKGVLKIFLLKIFFIGFVNSLFSQSGWNIRYNPINKLNESFVGKELFPDFKSNENDTISVLKADNKFKLSLKIRHLLANIKEDEIKLSISGKDEIYREDWRIYSDMGALSDQRLINLENEEEFIKDISLVKIVGDTICLKANLYTSKKDFTPIEFEVPRGKVKGFLTIR